MFCQFREAHIALVAMDPGAERRFGNNLQGLLRRHAVGRADAQVDDGIFSACGPLPVERRHFPVLHREEILFDGLRPPGWLDDHKAALYSPRMSRSSMRGRTAERAC